jgi:hypothetical protein
LDWSVVWFEVSLVQKRLICIQSPVVLLPDARVYEDRSQSQAFLESGHRLFSYRDWEDNIKMNRREIEWGRMDSINL